MPDSKPPVVVIVGGGFGGLWAARALGKSPVNVVLIDRTNHHLFQPLLYQVATAGLSPADIAHPIRSVLKKQKNTSVLLDEVVDVDREKREVVTKTRRIAFDYLILATGMRNSYFGHDEWAEIAPGLKSIDDATAVRTQILLAFEKAEMAATAEEQQRLLTFAIIGGGATGVELAGAIAELGKQALRRDFRRIDPGKTRVILIEGSGRILEAFEPSTSESAKKSLEHMGVEVRTDTRVTNLEEGKVFFRTSRKLGDQTLTEEGVLEVGTTLWAAGVRATPVAEWLKLPAEMVERSGKVKVTPFCTLADDDRIFVVGDAMTLPGEDGKPLPGVCQTAMQQGDYVADRIDTLTAEMVPTEPFKYNDRGNMATIGRKSAVAEIGRAKFAGFIAWMLWLFIHIMYLIGFDTKLRVLIQWAWAYIVWGKGARLITGSGRSFAK